MIAPPLPDPIGGTRMDPAKEIAALRREVAALRKRVDRLTHALHSTHGR